MTSGKDSQEERLSAAVPIDSEMADEMAREFAAMGLGPDALRAMTDLGYGAPTPIQRQAIPLLLAGRDVIAQAPTGTGKTAAYGLPVIERLDARLLVPQALIVTPTRELAIQVAEALHAFGKYREIMTMPIYGGQPYERQLRALARGVQVVVGTPGRLLDHIRRKKLDLSTVRTVVLDEADEMLNMGFIEDIEAILAEAPAERQTALFSATISPRITRLAERYLRQPEHVVAVTPETVGPRVRQVYYETFPSDKLEALARILDIEEPESAIVFVRTRRDADLLTEQLTGLGYLAQAIHGEIPQAQRELVLQRFRSGHTQLLVATDIAARGLDIPDVSHVINYDLPLEPDAYVHRIGRTGRAGRSGEALTLVTPRERRQLRLIEQATHRRLQPLSLPTAADVAARRRAAFREDVLKLLDAGQLDPFLALVEDLSGSHDPTELAAAAFKLAAQAREARRPSRGAVWEQTPVGAPVETPAGREAGVRERVGVREKVGVRERVGERERAKPRPPARGPKRMARLFLHVGRRDGVRPADLVGMLSREAGVPERMIGDIDIYDTFSFVEAPEDTVAKMIVALNQTMIYGRKPEAKLAAPGAEWQQRPKEKVQRRVRGRP